MDKNYEKINVKQGGYQHAILACISILLLFVMAGVLLSCFEKGKALDISGTSSIAVIPVANSMCDPGSEYISEGMHDAIINELGNINSLLVKSKTASRKYANSELSLQQVGSALDTKFIVKDFIICTEEGMRWKMQILQVSPEEKEIWSGTSDLDMENALSLARDMALQIARIVKADITPQEMAHLKTARQVNPEFNKNYLQGVFYMNKMTPEGIEKGFAYLNKAMAIDPTDPYPHLAIALGYSNAGHTSGGGVDAKKLAKEHALKALELDSTLAEAYTILATDYLYYEWDFAAAEKSLKHALDLNPNIAALQYTMGWYHLLMHKVDKAEAAIKQAVIIDPLDPICIGYLAWFYLFNGRYEDAIAAANKTLELESNYTMAYYVLGSVYAETGKYDLAIETHKKGIAISPDYLSGLGTAYARAGRRDEALAVAAELERLKSYPSTDLADIYAVLGDKDKAIYWIEDAYRQHNDFLPWIKQNSIYNSLQNDPRFEEIVSKLNLPDSPV